MLQVLKLLIKIFLVRNNWAVVIAKCANFEAKCRVLETIAKNYPEAAI